MNFSFVTSILWPFFLSAGLILINEMGDKSQLLAMAFAARMKLRKVLAGIFLAVLVLNAIAVCVGSLLASVPGWDVWIKFISSILFLVFGVVTLKGEKDDDIEKEKKKSSLGDIAVVFASFFFSEIGDKTQLVTISLAAQFPSAPFMILLGTTLGMMLADIIGIIAGTMMHHKLPEKVLKVISALLFIFFGISGLWQTLYDLFGFAMRTVFLITLLVGLITVSIAYIVFIKTNKNEKNSKKNSR